MKKFKNQKIDETPTAEIGTRASSSAAACGDASPSEDDELIALKDRYARLLADFDNFRKRQTREREEWSRRANELLLEDFLPVVDHLELALGNAPDLSNPFAAGVKMVYDQFIAALEKHGVTPLDAKGQPFNPDWHEALSQMPSETVPEGGVVEQFRRGWLIGGRLMRPAQVIVSSGASNA
jgi:molecular chaperone GrpE